MVARKIKNGWCCSFVKPISELSISGGATPPEFAGEIHGTHRGIRLPLSEAFGTEVLSGSLGPDLVVLTGGEFWCFKRERLVHEALNISRWFLIWDLPITHWKAKGLFLGASLGRRILLWAEAIVSATWLWQRSSGSFSLLVPFATRLKPVPARTASNWKKTRYFNLTWISS